MEIEKGIASFQNADLQKSLQMYNNQGESTLNLNKDSSLAAPPQQQTTVFENPMISTIQMSSPPVAMSTLNLSSGNSDVLSDFLRQSQYTKYQLKKNNLNFHNQLVQDKQLNKNQGGGGSMITNLYSINSHLKKPQDIIRDKVKEYKIQSPIDMKINSLQAMNTMKNDRSYLQRTFDIRSQNQKRDLSYRVEAVHSAFQERRLRDFQQKKGQMVESSVHNLELILTDEEKHQLLGKNKIQLPTQLKTIDEMINDRKLLLGELEEIAKAAPQENVGRNNQNDSKKIRPSNRVEFQVYKKQVPMNSAQTPFMKTMSRGFNTQSQQRLNTCNNVSESTMPLISLKHHNSRSMSSFNNTFNININTNNYYMSQQNNQTPFSGSTYSQDLQPSQTIFSEQTSPQNQSRKLINIPENRRTLQLGNPQSRLDAENLQKWFAEMLKKVEEEEGLKAEKRNELKMNVYHATFLEVARQVSVQCINRGELLKLLWNGFFSDLYRQLKRTKDEKDNIESKLKDEMDDQNLFYLDQLKRKNTEIDRLNNLIEDFKHKLQSKNKDYEDQKIETERWKLKCQRIMERYKESKMKLYRAEAGRSNNNSPFVNKHETEGVPRLELMQLDSECFTQEKISDTSGRNQNTESNFDLTIRNQTESNKEFISIEDKSLPKGKQNETISQFKKKRMPHSNTFNSSGLHQQSFKAVIPVVQKADKATDTNELRYCFDEETQTVGVSTMITQLAEEELRKLNPMKKRPTRVHLDLGMVSFEDDIDHIVAQETQLQEQLDLQAKEQEEKRLQKRHSILRKFEDLQQQEISNTEELELLNEQEKLLHQQRMKQTSTSASIGPSQSIVQTEGSDEINLNKNKVMQSFASGLKAGLLQKVIAKLKENFKQKEVLIKSLIEENRDLYMQLDIEKAKFSQVIKFKEEDQGQLLEMQDKCESMKRQLKKERNRHAYYKDLVQEVSNISEIKQKLNLSISDVDDQDDDEFFKAHGRRKDSKTHDNEGHKSHMKKHSEQIKDQGFDQSNLQLEYNKQSLMNIGMDDWALDNNNDEVELLLHEYISSDDSDQADQSRLMLRDTGKKNKSALNFSTKRQRNTITTHPSMNFINKIMKRLHLPRFTKLSCTLKQLLKTITAAYSAIINIYKNELADLKNAFTLKQTCVEFMYDQFLRKCGIKQMAEKRFAQTISAVMKYKGQILRVKMFGRFLNLVDPYDKESFKFFLSCLNYLLNVSTFGYPIPSNDQDEVHYTPYIRVNDFMRNYFENRISTDEYQELKLQYEQMDIIDFQAFYLIMLHVEENTKFTFQQIKNHFERNCETIAINSKKDARKYLTIEAFIGLCFQEKLLTKDCQIHLLNLQDANDTDAIMEHVLKFKNNMKEELEWIKRRFYYIYLYFKDLIQLITVLLEKYDAEKLRKRCKQIWILIRVLQEESKRQYQEIHAQKYMGMLDVFTFVNQGWILLEEQRNVFEISFLRQNTIKNKIKPSEYTFTTTQLLKIPNQESQNSSQNSNLRPRHSAKKISITK